MVKIQVGFLLAPFLRLAESDKKCADNKKSSLFIMPYLIRNLAQIINNSTLKK